MTGTLTALISYVDTTETYRFLNAKYDSFFDTPIAATATYALGVSCSSRRIFSPASAPATPGTREVQPPLRHRNGLGGACRGRYGYRNEAGYSLPHCLAPPSLCERRTTLRKQPSALAPGLRSVGLWVDQWQGSRSCRPVVQNTGDSLSCDCLSSNSPWCSYPSISLMSQVSRPISE